MEWENFSMEWKIFKYEMDDFEGCGIWKISIPFYSIVRPAQI